jgi:hypothetical protein
MTATERQFIPLGMKINNNTHTFLLVPLEETVLLLQEVGSPSPNWTELNSQVVGAPRTSLLEEKFSS